MLKEIDQKSIVKLYLCIMCIAILVVILLSCLFKKNNKEKKILFSSSICLLISINILEIIINYYKGYVRNYPFLYDIVCVKDILGSSCAMIAAEEPAPPPPIIRTSTS